MTAIQLIGLQVPEPDNAIYVLNKRVLQVDVKMDAQPVTPLTPEEARPHGLASVKHIIAGAYLASLFCTASLYRLYHSCSSSCALINVALGLGITSHTCTGKVSGACVVQFPRAREEWARAQQQST